MDNIFVFSGVDKFDINLYRTFFYSSSYFRRLIRQLKPQIDLEKRLIDGKMKHLTYDFAEYATLFNLRQVAIAQEIEATRVQPELIIGHSLGELSALVFNDLLSLEDLYVLHLRARRVLESFFDKETYNYVVIGNQSSVEAFCQETQSLVMTVNAEENHVIFSYLPMTEAESIAQKHQLALIPAKIVAFPIHTESLKQFYQNYTEGFHLKRQSPSVPRYDMVSFAEQSLIPKEKAISSDQMFQSCLKIAYTTMDYPLVLSLIPESLKQRRFLVIDEHRTYMQLTYLNMSTSKIFSATDYLKKKRVLPGLRRWIQRLNFDLHIYDIGSDKMSLDSLSYVRR